MCLAVVPGSPCWSCGNRSTSLLKTLKCLPCNRFLNLVLGRNKCDDYPVSTDLQSDWVLHRTTNIKRAWRSYGSAWITAVHFSKNLCCHATWSSNSRAHKRALSSWWRIAICVQGRSCAARDQPQQPMPWVLCRKDLKLHGAGCLRCFMSDHI